MKNNPLKNVKWSDFYKSYLFWFIFGVYWIYVLISDIRLGFDFTPIDSIIGLITSFGVAHVLYGFVLLFKLRNKNGKSN